MYNKIDFENVVKHLHKLNTFLFIAFNYTGIPLLKRQPVLLNLRISVFPPVLPDQCYGNFRGIFHLATDGHTVSFMKIERATGVQSQTTRSN